MQTPPNSLFVDTSGWADPILHNTTHHVAMERFYKEVIASKRPLVTTNYVLAELLALLSTRARASRPQILDILKRIPQISQLRIIHINEAIDDAAWAMLYHYQDKDWSLVDAASFALMRDLRITEAFTSDPRFAQAGLVRLPLSP